MQLQELANKLNLPFFGDGSIEISGIHDIDFPGDIPSQRLCFVASKKFLQKVVNPKQVTAVLTTDKLKGEFTNGIIGEEDSLKVTFAKLLSFFDRIPNFGSGVSAKASVHPSAKIGQNVTILDFAVVMEGVEIGDNCQIHPHVILEPRAKIGKNTTIRGNVVIGYDCEIGENCLIHSNTTIGADGFGFVDHKGARTKIPQIGNVKIGNHVEIGAGCTIDRAAILTTQLGEHTKIDDQVHIGHNCRVGNYVYIAGTAGLAGGVTLEDYVAVGGQAAIAEHLTVKKGSFVMGLTGVTRDVGEKEMVWGIPNRPFQEMLKVAAVLGDLPDLFKRVKKLEENKPSAD